jgi:hypothetical protein
MDKNIGRRKFLKNSALAIGAISLGGLDAVALSPSRKRRPRINVPNTLRFNAEGKFKIVQFTDIHAAEDHGQNKHSYDIMNNLIELEHPDLVMYTGDFGEGDNIYDRLVGFASSRGIPCAVAFGNHEPEDEKEREAILNHFAGLPGCLNVRKDEETAKLPGATNQIIPIYSSADSGKKSAILYLFDSLCDHHLPGYDRSNDWIKPEQIEWYVRHSKELTAENGGVPFPALAFFHIPLMEYEEAWADPTYKNMGWKIEREGCPPVNSGLFQAFLDCGDVKGVFCGHDHDNDYVVYKDGIALGYGRYSGGLSAYHTLCRGCRVIELTEGSKVFDTWTRMETSRMLYYITVPYSFTSDDPKYKPKP